MRLAPMPPAEPLLGHARELGRAPLHTLTRWMQEVGPVVRFRIGRREAHVVFSREAIRKVLSDPDGIYGKDTLGYRTLRMFVGDGLLTSDGELWVRQRRLLQPAFHRGHLAAQVTLMSETAERVARSLAATRGDVRVETVTMGATLDVVGRTLFCTDLLGRGGDIAGAITTLQVEANRRIAAPVTLPFAWPTPGHRRIRSARGRLVAILDALFEERRAPSAPWPSVLDLLREARDEQGRPLDRGLILDELITLLIAGHESTANALTWTLLLLARHPAKVRWLREELDAVLGGGPVTAEHLTSLVRTRAVVEESLRLYPPAWSFGRAPRRDDELEGFSMPRGGLVMIVPWAMHRDRSVFPDPEAFEPERFLDAEPPPFSFLPFGAGAHTCIGQGLARAEARVMIATWLRDLDFELLPGQSLEPEPLITLRPREGVRMRVTARRRDA